MEDVDVRLVTFAGLPAGDPETPLLLDALADRGMRADVRIWNDAGVDWSTARLTVIRSTWDYHTDYAGFLDWIGKVHSLSGLHNPPDLVRWNAHKSYLLDLRRKGLPVVDTVLIRAGIDTDPVAIARRRGWREIVLKPAISLDGHGVYRGEADDPSTVEEYEYLADRGDVIVQPFIASVRDSGEISVTFIEGEATHAVRKHPAPGDFRVQTRLGGSVGRMRLTGAVAELGARALGALPAIPLYARVDLVEAGGHLLISELELIEPSLFLAHSPESAGIFAGAIRQRLTGGTGERLSGR